MTDLGFIVESVRNSAVPIISVAAAAAFLTAFLHALASSVSAKRPAPANHRSDAHESDAHGGGHGHGDEGRYDDEDIGAELRGISDRLDHLSLQIHPKGFRLIPKIIGNVFWSVFGVVVGIVAQAAMTG